MKTLILTLLISLSALAQQNVYNAYPFSFGFTDTITAGVGRVDTLVNNGNSPKGLFKRKISGTNVTSIANGLKDTIQTYWGVSIVSDDTLEISTSPGFPTIESIVVLPDVPISLGPYQVRYKKNLYIRPRAVSGATGTARYYLYIYGW